MRKLLILIFLFISAKLSAQVYQVMPQYGYQTARMRMDSVLIVPSDTIRNKSGVARIGTQLYAGNGSYWTRTGGSDSSVLFTNYRADTMRNNIYSSIGNVPIPTLQQVLNNNHDLPNGLNYQGTGAGDGNQGNDVNAFGNNAANLNQGNDVNAFGAVSAQFNTGNYVNGIGYKAAEANSGNNVNVIGQNTGKDNTGSNVNALGFEAAYLNTGNDITAIGQNAGQSNAGNNNNFIGLSSGANNNASNVNAFGFRSALSNTGNAVNAFGEKAGENNSYSNVNLLGAYASATANNQTVFSLRDNATTINARIDYNRLLQSQQYDLPDSSGTIALLSNINNTGGTVTSIATGYGLSGGTITTSGTLTVDTSVSGLSGKYLRISDTTNKFLSSVSQPNDSSLTFTKDGTTSTFTIRSAVAGSATRLVTTVYNNTGSTITKGSVVYISGRHSSNLPTIALATGNNEANSYKTFALVDADIANNSSGIVIQAGNITGLNLPTSTYTDGDIVYLSPTVPGGITLTKPLAPNHICKIGSVTRAHPTFGSIEIKIENGWQLDELSDVQIAAIPADSVLLQFSRTDSLWHDRTITQAIGNYLNAKQDTSTAWKTSGNFGVNAGQFIGSRNNSSLRFRTNNTERMVLDSIGNVGIGVSPTSKLHVSGETKTDSLFINRWSFKEEAISGSDALMIRTPSSGRYLMFGRNGANNGFGNFQYAGFSNGDSRFTFNSNDFNISNPPQSALVNMVSTNAGLLIPRMTTTERNAISTPATGLMIYNTTDSSHYTYDGVRWNRQLSANGLQTITGTSQGGSSANGILDLSQTWNTTGTPTAIKLNVTNTASAANSRLMDLQVGGVSQFRVQTNSGVYVGNNTSFAGMRYNADQLLLTSNITGTTAGDDFNFTSGQGTRTFTTGTNNVINIRNGASQAFAPTSGTGVLNIINIPTVINQTGGANGITRGLHINPTLTSAADWRAIETTNGQLRMSDTYAAGSGSRAGSLLDLSQTWNTTGNPAAIRLNVTNTASGSTASLIDLQIGGTSYFKVDNGAKITQFATNTAAGTTGNQTINRPTGTVNIAAAGTTVTVTNNLVTANSLVFAVIRTNDATATIKNVVPGAGTFTINLNAATTAETSIGFWVIN